jgi:hypothetical protein
MQAGLVDTLWSIEDLYDAGDVASGRKGARRRKQAGSFPKGACNMDDRQKAERAIKGSVIDRIKLRRFEHDPGALDRDNRIERLFAMTIDELRKLDMPLSTTSDEKKVGVLVKAIVDSEHAREEAQRREWDWLDGGAAARTEMFP